MDDHKDPMDGIAHDFRPKDGPDGQWHTKLDTDEEPIANGAEYRVMVCSGCETEVHETRDAP